MECAYCCQTFPTDCTCKDRDERMVVLAKGDLVYRKCKLCRNHYGLCKCSKPEWIASDDTTEVN